MSSVILCNHAHSRDALYSEIIFEWLVDVATKVCLVDFQDIAVPLCKYTNPICDMTFWGSDK
jgi:hypothetical protein